MHLSNIRPYVMYGVMQLCGHLRPLTYWIAAVKAYFILWYRYLLVIELLKHYTTNSFTIKFSLFVEDSSIIQINLLFLLNIKSHIRYINYIQISQKFPLTIFSEYNWCHNQTTHYRCAKIDRYFQYMSTECFSFCTSCCFFKMQWLG